MTDLLFGKKDPNTPRMEPKVYQYFSNGVDPIFEAKPKTMSHSMSTEESLDEMIDRWSRPTLKKMIRSWHTAEIAAANREGIRKATEVIKGYIAEVENGGKYIDISTSEVKQLLKEIEELNV